MENIPYGDITELYNYYNPAEDDNKERKKEYQKIMEKALKDAYYDVAKVMFKKAIISDIMEGNNLKIIDYMNKEMKGYVETFQRNVCSKSPYCFLTVNPRPDVDIKTFKKVIQKIFKKKGIKSYYYVYEVRKPNSGLHAHAVLYYDMRPYDLKKGIKNTCKTICDISNPEILNFKFIPEDIVPAKILYMNGEKKESKKAGVEATVRWRTENSIEPYYESIPPLPCRDTKKIENTPDVEALDVPAPVEQK